VKVVQVKCMFTEKKITRAQEQAFLHVARIENIDDRNFTVISEVVVQKSQADSSYCWPNKEDKSSTERDEFMTVKDHLKILHQLPKLVLFE